MHEKQATSSTAIVIVVVLLIGLAVFFLLALAGFAAWMFLSVRDVAPQPQIVYESKSVYMEPADMMSSVPMEAPMDAIDPSLPMLLLNADGSLVWNNAPVTLAELREHLQQLSASGETPSQIQYLPNPVAPAEAAKQVHELLKSLNIVVVGPAMLGPSAAPVEPSAP